MHIERSLVALIQWSDTAKQEYETNKILPTYKQELREAIHKFWQQFITTHQTILQKEIEAYYEDLDSSEAMVKRLEDVLTGGVYRADHYLLKDLKSIYHQWEQQEAELQQLLTDYVLDLAKRLIVIPNANVFFRDFIVNHYDRIKKRIQLQFPYTDPSDLLHQVYETLTTRHKDKLPPKLEQKSVENYILGACTFLWLSEGKKKKNGCLCRAADVGQIV